MTSTLLFRLVVLISHSHSLDKAGMKWLHDKPTMLVGIDVTHPGPGSIKGTPSIAAVVASLDSDFGQFPASMQLQESKKEARTLFFSIIIAHLVS